MNEVHSMIPRSSQHNTVQGTVAKNEGYSHLFEQVLQVGGWHGLVKLCKILCVINTMWEKVIKVCSKSIVFLWEVTVERLVEEDHIYQAIMHNEWLPVFQDL